MHSDSDHSHTHRSHPHPPRPRQSSHSSYSRGSPSSSPSSSSFDELSEEIPGTPSPRRPVQIILSAYKIFKNQIFQVF